jgi:predicted metal-binding transcription factor (methanogenesis marker protein 9)
VLLVVATVHFIVVGIFVIAIQQCFGILQHICAILDECMERNVILEKNINVKQVKALLVKTKFALALIKNLLGLVQHVQNALKHGHV